MSNSNTIEQQIQERVQVFSSELSVLVREAAMEAVSRALVGSTGVAVLGRRKPGRPKGSTNAPKAAKKTGRGTRVRRTMEDLAQVSGRIVDYVKANSGARLEEISAGLKTPSKELKRPVTLLLKAKRLKKSGQKRGTMYFAGSKA